MLKKIAKKNKKFCAGPPPPPELHIRIFSFSDSCTPVIEFCSNPCTRVHDILFLFSNPCIWVHGILIFLQIHVPRYMEFRFFSLFLCVAQGVGVARCKKKNFFFQFFFQHVKKLINFWSFVKIKVAKFKLNHLG